MDLLPNLQNIALQTVMTIRFYTIRIPFCCFSPGGGMPGP